MPSRDEARKAADSREPADPTSAACFHPIVNRCTTYEAPRTIVDISKALSEPSCVSGARIPVAPFDQSLF